MRISDWSSDVCSSDLTAGDERHLAGEIEQRVHLYSPILKASSWRGGKADAVIQSAGKPPWIASACGLAMTKGMLNATFRTLGRGDSEPRQQPSASGDRKRVV